MTSFIPVYYVMWVLFVHHVCRPSFTEAELLYTRLGICFSEFVTMLYCLYRYYVRQGFCQRYCILREVSDRLLYHAGLPSQNAASNGLPSQNTASCKNAFTNYCTMPNVLYGILNHTGFPVENFCNTGLFAHTYSFC
jgi:hypothetical protein